MHRFAYDVTDINNHTQETMETGAKVSLGVPTTPEQTGDPKALLIDKLNSVIATLDSVECDKTHWKNLNGAVGHIKKVLEAMEGGNQSALQKLEHVRSNREILRSKMSAN